VIVAPDRAQSGMGHAVTINDVLKMEERSFPLDGIEQAWQTSGTPVDCVKLAIYEILGQKPDLLVSGINHGSNASINVIYSGTMSAAVEGAVEGIPSIGLAYWITAQKPTFPVHPPSSRASRVRCLRGACQTVLVSTLISQNCPAKASKA
jgi:5'/3'-nucleotidase SurE